jgi:hypothetical protein
MSRLKLLDAIKKIDTIGLCLMSMLAAIALGAGYAALHFR